MSRTVTRSLFAAVALSGLVALLAAPVQAVDITNSEDVWIRDIEADTTYNGDFLDIRRTIDGCCGAIEVRYGMVEFDLTSFTAQTLTSLEFHIDQLVSADGTGSSAGMVILTDMYLLDFDATAAALTSQTWNIYTLVEADGNETLLSTLGDIDLSPSPNGGGPIGNQFT